MPSLVSDTTPPPGTDPARRSHRNGSLSLNVVSSGPDQSDPFPGVRGHPSSGVVNEDVICLSARCRMSRYTSRRSSLRTSRCTSLQVAAVSDPVQYGSVDEQQVASIDGGGDRKENNKGDAKNNDDVNNVSRVTRSRRKTPH